MFPSPAVHSMILSCVLPQVQTCFLFIPAAPGPWRPCRTRFQADRLPTSSTCCCRRAGRSWRPCAAAAVVSELWGQAPALLACVAGAAGAFAAFISRPHAAAADAAAAGAWGAGRGALCRVRSSRHCRGLVSSGRVGLAAAASACAQVPRPLDRSGGGTLSQARRLWAFQHAPFLLLLGCL